ncbi:serine hydrolase domain-containing protein [Hyphomonas sp. NPDC076900]|uniref:serine hydrolase domain-containing protein n=1 Tax=unclassified Hyphomonas TaxID=2630699 RepID=UPI003D07A6FC
MLRQEQELTSGIYCRVRLCGIVCAVLLTGIAACRHLPAAPDADAPTEAKVLRGEGLDDLLRTQLQAGGVGIVAGVIDEAGANVASAGASGSSDGRPLDGDTVFQIGSVTKGFTSLLLADMVVRGEVGLDDPAGGYLPDGVSMPRRGRAITLRDLANHVSGLPSMPDNIDLHALPDPLEAYSEQDLFAFLNAYTPDHAPGEKNVYSNVGVALLGRLLAGRLGLTYEEALTQRVLHPLGMSSTSITLTPDQAARLAPGHDRYGVRVRTMEMRTLQASGSLRSTVNDLLKLEAAYLDPSDHPLRKAMDLQLREKLGWGTNTMGSIGHSGGKAGYRSAVLFDPALGKSAVVLMNARTYNDPMAIARALVNDAAIEPPPAPPPPRPRIEVTKAVLGRAEGRFATGEGKVYELVVNAPDVLVRYPNGNIYEFAAETDHLLFYTGGNDEIELSVDASGTVTGLKVYGDGREGGGPDNALRLQ